MRTDTRTYMLLQLNEQDLNSEETYSSQAKVWSEGFLWSTR